MFDWISNCADGVIFSGCIFNCLLDFTNLFNTVIVTTKISRDTAPSPAPMPIYNVRPLSVKDKKKHVISMGHKISIRACSQSMRISGNVHLYVCYEYLLYLLLRLSYCILNSSDDVMIFSITNLLFPFLEKMACFFIDLPSYVFRDSSSGFTDSDQSYNTQFLWYIKENHSIIRSYFFNFYPTPTTAEVSKSLLTTNHH